jgi:hypothetical protein
LLASSDGLPAAFTAKFTKNTKNTKKISAGALITPHFVCFVSFVVNALGKHRQR